MLRKKYRFHSRGGVKWVFKHGRTLRGPAISLVFAENTKGFTRVAVVVSRKVNKTAVGRNRIRRRIYEAVRKNFEDVPRKYDYIFVVRAPKALTMREKDLEKILGDLVNQAKVCYNKK